jgi:hypothetical protein
MGDQTRSYMLRLWKQFPWIDPFLEVLHTVKEERNILHTVKRRKVNWIGPILHRNYVLTHILEGRIEVTGRRGRRFKQLQDDLREMGGYWKLKEEALYRTPWKN